MVSLALAEGGFGGGNHRDRRQEAMPMSRHRARRPNRTTCLGDDTHFGWGTEIVTTMSCNKREPRFNFRFDNDPGPNAPLVAFWTPTPAGQARLPGDAPPNVRLGARVG
ncbi:hypothetical protein ACFYO2_04245 [Streptomyces sp. NPDC006602]|uniref:hypothetical protein n=1 Tax=Streptomyces sp. NPDC006602 TaxID=3364751 RepID=UPI003693E305